MSLGSRLPRGVVLEGTIVPPGSLVAGVPGAGAGFRALCAAFRSAASILGSTG